MLDIIWQVLGIPETQWDPGQQQILPFLCWCSWCHRWHTHHMLPICPWATVCLQLERRCISKLSHMLQLWFVISIYAQWVGWFSSRCCCVQWCSPIWLDDPLEQVLPCRCQFWCMWWAPCSISGCPISSCRVGSCISQASHTNIALKQIWHDPTDQLIIKNCTISDTPQLETQLNVYLVSLNGSSPYLIAHQSTAWPFKLAYYLHLLLCITLSTFMMKTKF